LLFALVYQGAHLFGGLLGLGPHVLGPLAGVVGDFFAGLTAALGGIQNPYQSAHAQSGYEPTQMVYLAFF
jgi:hypothetical protein